MRWNNIGRTSLPDIYVGKYGCLGFVLYATSRLGGTHVRTIARNREMFKTAGIQVRIPMFDRTVFSALLVSCRV